MSKWVTDKDMEEIRNGMLSALDANRATLEEAFEEVFNSLDPALRDTLTRGQMASMVTLAVQTATKMMQESTSLLRENIKKVTGDKEMMAQLQQTFRDTVLKADGEIKGFKEAGNDD